MAAVAQRWLRQRQRSGCSGSAQRLQCGSAAVAAQQRLQWSAVAAALTGSGARRRWQVAVVAEVAAAATVEVAVAAYQKMTAAEKEVFKRKIAECDEADADDGETPPPTPTPV